MRTYYIGLGSNLGDRFSNIVGALQALRRYVELGAVSSLYETAPIGVEGPNFLNAAAEVRTELDAADLRRCLERVETRLGRALEHDASARPIDLDLLEPGNELSSRVFYAVPLREIAPEMFGGQFGSAQDDLVQQPSRLSRAIRFEADRQSGLPDVPLSVDLVGVSRIKRIVSLVIDGREREVAGEFSMEADLAPDRAGVHMSRFSERLEGAMLEAFAQDHGRSDILTFMRTIAGDVLRSQHAQGAQVTMRAPFALERWTPVSGRRGEETYLMSAAAYASRAGVRTWIGVEVTGMTACPCAQMMMREQGRRELLEAGFSAVDADRALDALPAATHNQRGRGRLIVGLPESSDVQPYLEDLVEIVESSMSSETYELLKRPDEFFIVNKAHRNPRFVEDVVRGILARSLAYYRDLPGEAYLEASQVNDESIHKHDAIALAYGTFSELRAELNGEASAGARTNATKWLRGSL